MKTIKGRTALDADDIARLYESHSGEILRFLARRTLQPDVAVDLMAECFAVAFEQRGSHRGGDEGAARAWLYGIATNLLNNFFRRGVVERKALDRLALEPRQLTEHEYERIVELSGISHLRWLVSQSLAGMSLDDQAALRLRIVEERPYSEVAAALSVTEQTARARVSRALRGLRETVELLEQQGAMGHV